MHASASCSSLGPGEGFFSLYVAAGCREVLRTERELLFPSLLSNSLQLLPRPDHKEKEKPDVKERRKEREIILSHSQ